jgi:hypothetical protein
MSACAGWAKAQTQDQNQNQAQDSLPAATSPAPETVSLTVPKGTPLQVVIDREVKIERVSQPIHGRTVGPVYAFDKLVVPIGAEVTGKITQLDGVSNGKRTRDALNADFTPARKVGIEFYHADLAGS